MPLWWKDVDFKKRPAYRVRNPGGILTHLVLKAFKSYLFSPETPKTRKCLTNFRPSPCLPCIWYCKYAECACKLQKPTQHIMKNHEEKH